MPRRPGGAKRPALAIALAALLSRGLVCPIVELSRHIAAGDPVPVEGRGACELEELAQTFNQAIEDLVALGSG